MLSNVGEKLSGHRVRFDMAGELDDDSPFEVLHDDIQTEQRVERVIERRGDIDRPCELFGEDRGFHFDRSDLGFRGAAFAGQRRVRFGFQLRGVAHSKTRARRRVYGVPVRKREHGIPQVCRGDRERVFPALRHEQRDVQAARGFHRVRRRLHADRRVERHPFAFPDRADAGACRNELARFLPRVRFHGRFGRPAAGWVGEERLGGDVDGQGTAEFVGASGEEADELAFEVVFVRRGNTPDGERDTVYFGEVFDIGRSDCQTGVTRTHGHQQSS